MKNLIIFSSFLALTSLAHAQLMTEAEIEEQKAVLANQLQGQLDYTKREQARYDAEVKKIQDKKEELAKYEEYEKNFAQERIIAIDQITDKIKKLPVFQKLGSKAGFYKCLRSSLEEGKALNFENCQRSYSPSLSDEDNELLNDMKTKVGKTLKEVQIKKELLPREIQNSEALLPGIENNKKFSEKRQLDLEKSIQGLEIKKEEVKFLSKNTKYLNCDESSPEINLESEVPFDGAGFKGPFHGVPRDNQDGLGTCYANAAKNLLVGISGGEDVASFLDMALVYKSQNDNLASGLDGGNSCPTLDALAKKGYCPQEYAPLENGERNIVGEGLFNLDAYNYLATNVNMVRDFLNDLEKFQKSSNPMSQTMMAKAQSMIQQIKARPDIKIPLPIARFEIPERWKLREAFAGKNSQVKESEFLKEYEDSYKSFYPLYVKAIIQGKTQDQIFDLWTEKMKPFIEKYSLQSNLPEFKRVWKINVSSDFSDPSVKKQLRASLDFLKDVLDQKDVTDEAFLELCASQGGDAISFLGALNPLVEKLRANKLNEDKLFDKDGKFRSAQELMQLTVAPSCLNEENRKKLPAFSCSSGYDVVSKAKKLDKPYGEKLKALRETITLSLLNGYPLGNTFPTNGGWHINTIVGMRFNKTAGRCEYLIRESQTGTSDWHPETRIFDKIEALTEVRKLK